MGEDREVAGIVGYSEDSFGDLLVMHECPKCGTKWYTHLSHESDPELNKMLWEDMLCNAEDYGVSNPDLLIKKKEVK